ncbi:MAG: GntR family transcriptional regulator [Firmicutes bacterium]|nr:GntR family transcriptional regulator [Bacillota bacterium]
MREHRTISIADQIFDQLERDILTGKYKRGELLSEQRLAEDLGVSRTPVREAVRRLEQEDMIEDSGRGLVVVGISKEDMPDMYEIRMRIEGLAAQRAADRITDDELSEMGDILDMQGFFIEKQSKTDSDNSDKIKDLDSQFHELLYRCSGSKPLCDILIPMHRKMTKFRKASVRKKSRASASQQEHLAIFEALKAHDGEQASALMMQHLMNARDSIMSIEED